MSAQNDALKQALREHDAEVAAAAGRKPIRTRDDIRSMTADEINDRWDEVKAILSQGDKATAPPEDDAA